MGVNDRLGHLHRRAPLMALDDPGGLMLRRAQMALVDLNGGRVKPDETEAAMGVMPSRAGPMDVFPLMSLVG
jgi:hypothetical protein